MTARTVDRPSGASRTGTTEPGDRAAERPGPSEAPPADRSAEREGGPPQLRSRHLLGIAGLDADEITLILDTAVAMK
jgi:hypothetical protein